MCLIPTPHIHDSSAISPVYTIGQGYEVRVQHRNLIFLSNGANKILKYPLTSQNSVYTIWESACFCITHKFIITRISGPYGPPEILAPAGGFPTSLRFLLASLTCFLNLSIIIHIIKKSIQIWLFDLFILCLNE